MHLCGGDGLLAGIDPEENRKQLKKQRNRAAAQRSRQKHTDKADALHQQHESLERHNTSLRKEIQALRAELSWWSHALRLHERQCHVDCAPLPASCWGQAERLPDQPTAHGHHVCPGQPGLFQTPGPSPPAQLSPCLHHKASPALLSPPLPLLSLGPTVVITPPTQLSPSPVLSASPTGPSQLESSSNLSAPLPSPLAQPLGLGPPSRGKLVSSPCSPPATPVAACPQSREDAPGFPGAPWQALAVERSPRPGLAFPLLSSAQVPF